MKKYVCLFLLVMGLNISIKTLEAQVVQVITEDYKISKDSCRLYIYELRDYLKSLGLYEGWQHKFDTIGPSLRVLKNKLTFEGKFLADNYQFIIEIWGTKYTEDIFDDWGSFGLIEMGFSTEEEAHQILLKARELCKKYPMNIPPYGPPFRAVKAGKNVLIGYAINVNYDKFRNMVEKWKPGM